MGAGWAGVLQRVLWGDRFQLSAVEKGVRDAAKYVQCVAVVHYKTPARVNANLTIRNASLISSGTLGIGSTLGD